jgi:hypothetical protein
MNDQTIYSFILDADPDFTYQGWHLARSLLDRCEARPSQVHVHCTSEVSAWRRELFLAQGYNVHALERVGEGKYCNKIAQTPSLKDIEFGKVVLLDTDTIAIADLRPFLPNGAIGAKIVDATNPPIEVLKEIAFASGLQTLPDECSTDLPGGLTLQGNFNGGMYAVPKAACESLARAWLYWCLWLLDNVEPLRRGGSVNHVDQIAFWLAVQHEMLSFRRSPPM